jgi:molecular chaperone DnaK (HSP70)
MSAALGIDFGSLYGVVAVAQKGGIDVLMNEVSSRQTRYKSQTKISKKKGF